MGGLCGACGTCHDHVAAQPSPRPTVSPVMWIFAPLVSTPGEISFPCSALLCLQLGPQRGDVGGGNQTRSSRTLCVPVLLHAPSETVNHSELLTGFVILNRVWTQLSRGESTMSYCNSFCQPILSWTQQYFNLKIQPQNPQHFQLLYFITTQLKTTLFFSTTLVFLKWITKPGA